MKTPDFLGLLFRMVHGGRADSEAAAKEAAAPPPSSPREKPDDARVAAFRSLLAISEKLKKIEPCTASSHEGRPCITRDARWCGREVARCVRALLTSADKAGLDAATWADLRETMREWMRGAGLDPREVLRWSGIDADAALDEASRQAAPEHPAVALLRDIEFKGEASTCPACRAWTGHDDGCRLAAIIAGSKPGERDPVGEAIREAEERGSDRRDRKPVTFLSGERALSDLLAEEREGCAQVAIAEAQTAQGADGVDTAQRILLAIRARGQR